MAIAKRRNTAGHYGRVSSAPISGNTSPAGRRFAANGLSRTSRFSGDRQAQSVTKTCLICADHALGREALADTVRLAWPEARMALAIDFQQALIMASAQPELIICDLNMSGAGLLAGVDGMIQIAPNSPLLVIIDGEDDALLIDLLDRCVAGVASKSASGAIIDAALRLILAGGRYFPPRVADIARCGIDDQPTSGDLPGNAARLTGRQIEVLKLIAEGHSNKAIAKILGLAPSTVKSHISQVFSCLGAINRTDASIKARRLGLI